MDKIQIKGLVQGKRKLKNGGFAVGFRTKWGTVWVTIVTFPRLFTQCPSLEKLFEPYVGAIDEREFIGRYIYVTNKAQEREVDGLITVSPRL